MMLSKHGWFGALLLVGVGGCSTQTSGQQTGELAVGEELRSYGVAHLVRQGDEVRLLTEAGELFGTLRITVPDDGNRRVVLTNAKNGAFMLESDISRPESPGLFRLSFPGGPGPGPAAERDPALTSYFNDFGIYFLDARTPQILTPSLVTWCADPPSTGSDATTDHRSPPYCNSQSGCSEAASCNDWQGTTTYRTCECPAVNCGFPAGGDQVFRERNCGASSCANSSFWSGGCY